MDDSQRPGIFLHSKRVLQIEGWNHFAQVDDETEVQLVQSGIQGTDKDRVLGHVNCRSCWTFYLVNLQSVLEPVLICATPIPAEPHP